MAVLKYWDEATQQYLPLITPGATGLTDEQVEDLVAGMVTAGENVTVTYDDTAGTLTIDAAGGGGPGAPAPVIAPEPPVDPEVGLMWVDSDGVVPPGAAPMSAEEVEDIVAGLITAGTNVTVTYDDTAGTLTISAAGGSSGLTQEQVEDAVAAMVVAGDDLAVTYDDTAGTLTFDVVGLSPVVTPLASADWQLNGSAAWLTSSSVRLVNGLGQGGSAVSLASTIPVDGTVIEFTADLSTLEADGLSVGFLDPSRSATHTPAGGSGCGRDYPGCWTINFHTFSGQYIRAVSGPTNGSATVAATTKALATWKLTFHLSSGVLSCDVVRNGVTVATGLTFPDTVPFTQGRLFLGAGTGGYGGNADISGYSASVGGLKSAAFADASQFQPLDSDLTDIAALSTTSYGRAFLALADAAAGRTALGLDSAVSASIVDAKGDLIVATADNTVARRAVPSNQQVMVADSSQSDGWINVYPPMLLTYSIGKELAVENDVYRWYNKTGRVLTIRRAWLSIGTAPTGSQVKVRINKNGSTVFTTGPETNAPVIAAGAYVGAAAVPEVTSIADGDYLTFDVTAIGSTVKGSYLTISVLFDGGA